MPQIKISFTYKLRPLLKRYGSVTNFHKEITQEFSKTLSHKTKFEMTEYKRKLYISSYLEVTDEELEEMNEQLGSDKERFDYFKNSLNSNDKKLLAVEVIPGELPTA